MYYFYALLSIQSFVLFSLHNRSFLSIKYSFTFIIFLSSCTLLIRFYTLTVLSSIKIFLHFQYFFLYSQDINFLLAVFLLHSIFFFIFTSTIYIFYSLLITPLKSKSFVLYPHNLPFFSIT